MGTIISAWWVVRIEQINTWKAPHTVWLGDWSSLNLEARDGPAQKKDQRSLCQLCVIYRSQFHILIQSLCLFLSTYLPVSSLTPIPKASEIFKHPLKENCMVSATGMRYPFPVAVRSSLPGPQTENPSWAEEPCGGVSWMLTLSHFPAHKVTP